jgi:hypothetical protein
VIDPVRESEEISRRSAELATLLDEVSVQLDRAEVARQEARSRELGDEAWSARSRAVEAVKKGRPLEGGVVLGVVEPIRRVPSGQAAYNDFMIVDGRDIFTPQLSAYWRHRRDQLAPALRTMYGEAEVATIATAPLRAAAEGHLAQLRQRGSLADEGGARLAGALERVEVLYHDLHQRSLGALDVGTEAAERLASIEGQTFKAKVVERDPSAASVDNAVLGRLAELTHGPAVFDAKTGAPLEPPVPAGAMSATRSSTPTTRSSTTKEREAAPRSATATHSPDGILLVR